VRRPWREVPTVVGYVTSGEEAQRGVSSEAINCGSGVCPAVIARVRLSAWAFNLCCSPSPVQCAVEVKRQPSSVIPAPRQIPDVTYCIPPTNSVDAARSRRRNAFTLNPLQFMGLHPDVFIAYANDEGVRYPG
jgi:hypothetical protein